jgi:hypothetical protein
LLSFADEPMMERASSGGALLVEAKPFSKFLLAVAL